MNFPITFADVVRISPMIALFLFSLVPITIKVMRGNQEPNPTATLLQGLGGLLIAGILTFMVAALTAGSDDRTIFAEALVMDGLTAWVSFVVLVAAAASLILMYDHPATQGDQYAELVFLTLSSVLGMLILVSAYDLLVLFIGLETMSLSLYLMIGMSHEQRYSKEAAFKYFVLGSFASAILLYGIAFLFGTVGSTSISELIGRTPELLTSSRLFVLGLVLVTLGFCFKVSVAPFHAWTPDVYEGAPTPHTALMSTAVKAVSFAAFLRLLATKGLVGSENLFDVLQWLAVLTMIVGNVAAIVQNNLKRMLAYSSIAHSGYLLVGMITAGSSDDMTVGATSVVFYLVGYVLMTLGSFAVISLLEQDEKTALTADSLAGFAKKKPMMALALTVFMLSLAGIPPTLGFFGKLYLFTAAVSQGLLWLALWGVINSAVSAYYYLRPIVMMYMQDSEDRLPALGRWGSHAVAGVFGVLTIVLGIFSGSLYDWVQAVLG